MLIISFSHKTSNHSYENYDSKPKKTRAIPENIFFVHCASLDFKSGFSLTEPRYEN